MAFTKMGKLGVQIKTLPNDFVASLEDGRLGKELALMRNLDFAVLILEGWLVFKDGYLVQNRQPTRFTQKGVRNILRSCHYQFGVWVEQSSNANETLARWLELVEYFSKEKHLSLYSRPPINAQWGVPSRCEQLLYILQGFPGVGPETARRILEHFGRVPLRWDVSQEDLMAVDGIGPKKAKQMMEILEGASNDASARADAGAS
jgi:Fanconi anemia group M protein